MQANVGNLDRLMRVVAGLVLVACTLMGVIGAWGWIGVVFIATGALRFCPAYLPFGMSTCKLPEQK